GEEYRIAQSLLSEGADTLLVIGGDGTSSNVARAIVEQESRCRFGVIPAGTGNDLTKTLGVSGAAPEAIVALVAEGRSALIDVGKADDHYFFNSCGFGFDAAVLEASNKVRWLRGYSVYIYSALRQLFTYRGVDVAADDEDLSRMLMVTVSNGQWLGGAFHIAPGASATDGKLDIALIRNSGVVERALLFLSATRGSHVGRSSVKQMQLPRVTLRFSCPPTMEIDGELRYAKASTIIVECIPRALSVIAAPGALDSGRTTTAINY
ncbi:MAG TPA: diacylglycerol kinase family protein, partial [Gemmatimonadaceae bacterium]